MNLTRIEKNGVTRIEEIDWACEINKSPPMQTVGKFPQAVYIATDILTMLEKTSPLDPVDYFDKVKEVESLLTESDDPLIVINSTVVNMDKAMRIREVAEAKTAKQFKEIAERAAKKNEAEEVTPEVLEETTKKIFNAETLNNTVEGPDAV